jgi:hypothetical protein
VDRGRRIGGVVGVVQLYLESALLYWTGRLIDLPGSFRGIQIVVGWKNMPWLVSLFVWTSASLLIGRHLFVENPTEIQYASEARLLMAALAWMMVAIGFLLGWIWSLVLLIQGLTVVNNCSAGRVIAHLIVVVLILGALTVVAIPLVGLALR